MTRDPTRRSQSIDNSKARIQGFRERIFLMGPIDSRKGPPEDTRRVHKSKRSLPRVTRAPTALDGAREPASERQRNYGAAGLAGAAGLLASAGLAAAAGLPASLAAADAAASGAAGAVSSDLLHAAAVKNIETSARSRTLRIAFSLITRVRLGPKLETRQEYDRCSATSSAQSVSFSRVNFTPFASPCREKF